MKPSITRPAECDGADATGTPPRRSPKEMERLESERRAQMLSCLEELLAVTAAMPEQELPMAQASIVTELAAAGAVEPLAACLNVNRLPVARLQSAGPVLCACCCLLGLDPAILPATRMRVGRTSSLCAELLERMITVQSSVADEVVNHDGVALCVQALLHPDSPESKPKSIALKSGSGSCGTDTFTPRLRAALLLKAMCLASDRAKAALAAPPSRACLHVTSSVACVTCIARSCPGLELYEC